MAITEWIGTTTDGALGANWTNGPPDDAATNVLMGGSSILSIVTNFASVRARGTLTGSTNFVSGDNLTIDTKVYTYAASPSADGTVDVGVDLQTSLDNLMAAINLETPIGGKYGVSMTLHPTVLALSSSATTLIVAAKDAGTAGDAIVTDEDTVGNVGDGTWGANTLEGGAADGATMGNIYQEAAYPGNIHTSGTKPAINCGVWFHRGPGQISIDVVNCTRLVIDSPNYALAADITMTSSLVMLEIVQGRAKLHAPVSTALPDKIFIDDIQGQSENLRLTGDSTLTGAQLIIAAGIVSVDGPAWTALDNITGDLTIVAGAVTTLRSSGLTTLKATETMTTAYIMGGDFDLTQGSGAKTVGTVWLGRQAAFHRRDDIDTFTLHEIGRK